MYLWPGMIKISKLTAVSLFEFKSIYLLFEDNTESEAQSIDDIIKHDGEIGIERPNYKGGE